MSTNFSKDLCGKNGQNSVIYWRKKRRQNSVRIYAEIMSTKFSQDLCGKNVEKNSVRIYAEKLSTKISKDLCGNNLKIYFRWYYLCSEKKFILTLNKYSYGMVCLTFDCFSRDFDFDRKYSKFTKILGVIQMIII